MAALAIIVAERVIETNKYGSRGLVLECLADYIYLVLFMFALVGAMVYSPLVQVIAPFVSKDFRPMLNRSSGYSNSSNSRDNNHRNQRADGHSDDRNQRDNGRQNNRQNGRDNDVNMEQEDTQPPVSEAHYRKDRLILRLRKDIRLIQVQNSFFPNLP